MKNLFIILCLLLLCFIPANAGIINVVNNSMMVPTGGGGYATPAFVTGQSNGSTSTSTVTLTGNSTTGNTLVVLIGGYSTTESTTLSGGGVTTWNYTSNVVQNGQNMKWAYGYVTTGGSVSITTSNAPTDYAWCIAEYSGIASSSALDQQASAAVEFSTWSSGNTSTTSQTHELLLGGIGSKGTFSASPTWDSGWTMRQHPDNYLALADRVVTSTGAYAASGTDTSYSSGLAMILTLKAASL